MLVYVCNAFVCCSVFMETINKESCFLLHNSLHLITAPVLVVWGKEDQVTMSHQDEAVFVWKKNK